MIFPAVTSALTLATLLLGIGSAACGRYAPLGERSMTDIRGASKGNNTVPKDVCGDQNINLNGKVGQQTARDCATQNGGPQYPDGDCIDCGTQSILGKDPGKKLADPDTAAASCNLITMKIGRCWRSTVDGAQVYWCMNPQPDAENTPCAGTVPVTKVQNSTTGPPVNP